ncbi:MAG: DSD1 family PLP-dependent enzyme [Kiritimatiellaeota bacterium]|nr:DSD1 family PLP-dependent enzyme [Kiritimatiellota bacterium]
MNDTLQRKADLDTPCLALDLDILDQNLRKMQALTQRAGKHLRPHAKTHKCSTLARRQMEAGAIGICTAKVSEAEALCRAGIANILITGPVVTKQKIARLVALRAKAPALMVVVDHPGPIDLLSTALGDQGLTMDVLLDVDVGLHRTGVPPSIAINLADHILDHSNLRLRGIQAYAGQMQHVRSYNERKNGSHQCLQPAIGIFRALQAKAPTCTVFSASGTGTSDIDLDIPELTELQAGSYVCMDAEYLAIGSAEDNSRFTAFGPALRLLTTVVSVNQDGYVTVDAGLKALYRDGAVPQIINPEYAGLRYDWFGDEYGRITGSGSVGMPPLGTVLELVTSHCDPTINLFDRYYVTQGSKIVDTWSIDLRGCSQ